MAVTLGLTDQQIQQQVQLFLRSDSSDITGNVQTWINLSQQKVCLAARWQFMLVSDTLSITTGAGNGPYSLTRIMAFPAKPGVNNIYPSLEEGRWDQQFIYQAMAAGAPKIFIPNPSSQPGSVLIYPTPDQSYTVQFPYYSPLVNLPFNGSQNYLSQLFPDVLISGGVLEGLMYLGANQDFQSWIQRFGLAMAQLAKVNLTAAEASAFEQAIYTPQMAPPGRGQGA